MKLLIVDDEKHVITSIRYLVPARQLGISEILSAQTASEAKMILEKERPEIAIVDIILHNQTGMSLLSFIINRQLPTQVIAISGHADYEYVRTMLLNGAVDYLLKPVESKALISSLQKAIQRVAPAPAAAEPESASMYASLSTQYLRAQLRKMLTPSNIDDAYAELCSLDSQFTDVHECTLLYYDLDYLPTRNLDFRHHLNLFEEKVKSYLSLHKCGCFLDKFSSQHEHLILLFNNSDDSLHQAEHIATSSFASTAFPFHLGLARSISFPEDFSKGFEQARECFFADDCYLTPEIIQKRPRSGAADALLHSRPDMERRLLSLIVIQDLKALADETDAWLSATLLNDAVSLGTIRSLIEFYNAMHGRWIQLLKEHYPDFTYDGVAERISFSDFLDEYYAFSPQMMIAGIQRSLRLFAKRVGKSGSDVDVFKRIAFYMELNYDQPFNQADYAQMFHLNRDYLSRKFKQIFGEGMVSYLNRLRITHAEQLMHNPDLKIRNIAYMTGFSDEKYFTRQFKEFTHVTPSEYRAMLQLNASQPDP